MNRPAALALLSLLAASQAAVAIEVTVTATPITSFRGVEIDGRADQLIFRGGIAMQAQDDTFGGLSGLAATGLDHQVVFASDRGNFITGRLAYDDADRLFGFIGVAIEPMRNSRGDPLPRQFARDAESIDTVYRNGLPVAVRVGFENLTRVADYALTDGVPGGPAREIAIPEWLANLRTNESLESLCVAPPASPIAGSTLLLAEAAFDKLGNHRGWLLGQNDKGPIGYANSDGVNPTECAFLPNGDLLVLERGIAMLSFSMQLRLVPAAEVRPDTVMTGKLLLSASGSTIDNMENMTVHVTPGGETRIVIGSDNNFNDWQRSILMEFALPQGVQP